MSKIGYKKISFIFLLIGLCLAFFVYPDPFNSLVDLNITEKPFKLGLDLQGGTQLTYQAELSEVEEKDKEERMYGLRDLIEQRIDVFGIAEPLVQVKGDRLLVELAGVVDPLEAMKMIGETPFLEFKEVEEKEEVTEEMIEMSSAYNVIELDRAEEVLSQVNQGGNFSELALTYSDDHASAQQGGDLGWFKKGTMVEEFEDAVFNISKGEIKEEIVETVFGYHIIQKTEDENEQGEIRASHILIKKTNPEDFLYSWKRTELGGQHLKTARYGFDNNTGDPMIELEFTDEGSKIFETITERNINKPLAIFLDGKSIIDTDGDGKITSEDLYAPMIQEKISGGSAIITGENSIENIRRIVSRLRSGALPVPIELISYQNVGPILGMESLTKSLKAGLFGFVLVVIFIILIYRLPGLLASVSLFLYIIIALSLFKIIPITLTLSGIAGFILSIGMAIDANILIFARMREEKALGNNLKNSIKNGFERSWPSIRDGNLTTLIVALILFFIGTSFVKGFALTLIIGISVSVFSAIIITKVFLRSFEGTFFEKIKFLWK
jgi:protein-export membrane protein SecD